MQDESGTSVGGTIDEVWLRGNQRPVAAFTACALVIAGAAVATAAWQGGLVAALWTGCALAAVLVPWLVLFAVVAARPRLRRRDDMLEVRLSPFAAHGVPLEVVECVFPGSRPLPPRSGAIDEPLAVADRRVTTVIIRLAERAAEWRARPSFAPWGSWEDGHIVIDGRWSEPLSPERIRALAARLIAARQGRAGDCGGSIDG